VNAQRAALEWLVSGAYKDSIDRSRRHKGMRGVKNAAELDFWTYAKQATQDRPEMNALIKELVSSLRIIQFVCRKRTKRSDDELIR
jgi:hypothetical protein